MEIDKILEYQKLDSEIRKLELKLLNNPDKQMINKLLAVVKDAQITSNTLEKEAESAMLDFKKMQKNYNETLKTISRLDGVKDNEFSEEQLVKSVSQLNGISNYLSGLEKKIMAFADKVNSILSAYDVARKNYNNARTKHQQHKENLEKLTAEIEPKINDLKVELSKLEVGLDKNFLAKYKAKRQELFPVVVPLLENSCGRCMMELSLAQIEKLKKDGCMECENCHRIIYYK